MQSITFNLYTKLEHKINVAGSQLHQGITLKILNNALPISHKLVSSFPLYLTLSFLSLCTKHTLWSCLFSLLSHKFLFSSVFIKPHWFGGGETTVDLLQKTLKSSGAGRGGGGSWRGWSHIKGDVSLAIWLGLENISWLNPLLNTLRCFNFNNNW